MSADQLAAWREESDMLASLRDLGVLRFVRSRGPVEIQEKRQEAKALQEKVNQLLAEAAQIEAVLLAATVEPEPSHRPRPHHHPDMAETVAA